MRSRGLARVIEKAMKRDDLREMAGEVGEGVDFYVLVMKQKSITNKFIKFNLRKNVNGRIRIFIINLTAKLSKKWSRI